MNSMNLLPKSRVEAVRRRARIRVWSVVCPLYAATLLGAWGAMAASADTGDTLRDDLARLEARAEETRGRITEVRRVLAAERRGLVVAQALGEHPDFSILLSMLARSRSDKVTLQRVDLAPVTTNVRSKAQPQGDTITRRYQLLISGTAEGQRTVTAYIASLEELGLFESVTLKETRARNSAEPDGPALVGFELSCVLADESTQPAGGER